VTDEKSDLDAEISRIRANYPENSIHIVYDHEGGYWAVAISQIGANPGERVIAFGGSKDSLMEAVVAVKPVEPKKPQPRRKRSGPTNG
jgi:hypothetical protein